MSVNLSRTLFHSCLSAVLFGAALTLSMLTPDRAYAQYTFTPINDPSAINGTIPLGLDDGSIVGYYYDANNSDHGFLYNGTTFRTIDNPSGSPTTANGTVLTGIEGNFVSGAYDQSNRVATGFIYDLTSNSFVRTINAPFASTVVANSRISNSAGTGVEGIDGDNVVGVQIDNQGICHGFVYNISTSTFTTSIFDDPQASLAPGGTEAIGISGNNTVGMYVDGFNHINGFLHTGTDYSTNYTTIDDPLGVDTIALSIDGSDIVGYYIDQNHIDHGFLYDGSSYTTIDAPYGVGTEVTGVDDGTIVGYNYTNGNIQGFIGTPTSTPEPGSIALLAGLGVTGLNLLARRRRLRRA